MVSVHMPSAQHQMPMKLHHGTPAQTFGRPRSLRRVSRLFFKHLNACFVRPKPTSKDVEIPESASTLEFCELHARRGEDKPNRSTDGTCAQAASGRSIASNATNCTMLWVLNQCLFMLECSGEYCSCLKFERVQTGCSLFRVAPSPLLPPSPLGTEQQHAATQLCVHEYSDTFVKL